MKRDKWHSKKYKNRSEMQKASWTEERKHKQGKAHSNVMKELWADPVYRKKMMKVRKDQVTNKERNRLKKLVQDQWNNNYEKMCKARKKQANVPGAREANSVRVTKLWKDPKYRKRVMKTRNKTMYNNPTWIAQAVAGLAKGRKRASKKNFGLGSWNAMHTKESHPSLMRSSKKLQGVLPQYNKYKCWYPCEKDQQIEMRSSYEVSFALWMNDGHIRWVYEPRWFNIGSGDWRGTSYTPDFYLPNQDTYVELKGYLSPENKKKMKRFRKRYPEVELFYFTGSQLKQIRKRFPVKAKVLKFKKAG